jgi:NAD+ kinase
MKELVDRYGNNDVTKADVIVALGGDGFLLSVLHRYLEHSLPVFGLNRGTVGFLMNEHKQDGLLERLDKAEISSLIPLTMTATDGNGEMHESLAFNEVSVFRHTRQAAHIALTVDGVQRMDRLICDGCLVATPAGSTAYNLSADGPVIPLDSNLLALTPISAYRPRRWKGALLPSSCRVRMDNLNEHKRPLNATADFVEVRKVRSVEIAQHPTLRVPLLHDPHSSLDERMLQEQFLQ